MTKSPITIRIPKRAVRRADGLVRLLHAKRRRVDAKLVHAFAFKADELPFARRLLDLHARIWLFRCGNAFVELRAAIEEIADELGVLTRDHQVVRATGDGMALVHLFNA